jgi:hypothetical protein
MTGSAQYDGAWAHLSRAHANGGGDGSDADEPDEPDAARKAMTE